ncbi:MAG TPA: endonuclease domain-containing protein [Gammaproteobacteria bacterium]|nr:endonuclease domain-containing protein [Gammaproteobacteria bacterium]
MQQHLNPPLPTRSRARARGLRQQSTDAEIRLWYHLRAGRLNGYKFRRQHPVPPYVVDFYCDSAKLVVELDGSQHDGDSDAVRTRHLEQQGLKVIRFWDNEVLAQTEIVMEAILNVAQGRTLTPSPSPEGRGE